jgi:hypothetical protein
MLAGVTVHGRMNQLVDSRLFNPLLLLDRKSMAVLYDLESRPDANWLGIHA